MEKRSLYRSSTKGSSQDTICLKEWKYPAGEVCLCLKLPLDMEDMDAEHSAAYYPYEQRPEIILADPPKHLQMTFSQTAKPLKSS